MDDLPIEDSVFLKKSKWLVHALIVSLTLNCALIATLCFFALKKNQELSGNETRGVLKKKMQPATETIASQLKTYFHENVSTLIQELSNHSLVEEGQKRCDLALACLVFLHHFDLERALPGISFEKREVTFSFDDKEVRFPLFTGLPASAYTTICAFAKGEMYPFTPKGVFQMLAHSFPQSPADLKETFFHSSEFHFIERALVRAGFKGDKEEVLQLLIKGSWDVIIAFSKELRSSERGTFESLGSFLTYFIEKEEPLAAQLLIELDQEYAIKKLSDVQLEKVLALAQPSSDASRAFFQEAANGLRADRLRAKAGQALSSLSHFEQQETPQKIEPQVHFVLPGDTLWKIASKYGISVSDIREANALHSSHLFAGQVLKIPGKVFAE